MKIEGSGSASGSGSISQRHGSADPDPDPLVRGMDPRIRIWIHTKMSWIRKTAFECIQLFLVSKGLKPEPESKLTDT
jgi:hypothetical protein